MHRKVIYLQPNTGKGITSSPAYLKLQSILKAEADMHINEHLANDPERVTDFQHDFEGVLTAKYAMNPISRKALSALIELAKSRNLKSRIERMYNGELVNKSEGRAALHTALRNVAYADGVFTSKSPVYFNNEDVMPDVVKVLNQMTQFVNDLHSGEWTGRTGKKITNVVSIGIGGSDKGPRMVSKTLENYQKDGIKVSYIASTDAAEFKEVMNGLNTEETLFIIESKSFTTGETMANANAAKEWFLENGGTQEDIAKHFVAASTEEGLVSDFGIDTKNMFPFWDWVGGRVSIASAIGLPVMVGIGPEKFAEFLEGQNIVDEHFKTAPIEKNLPILLALMDFKYREFDDMQTRTVAIYNYLGKQFPTYLQQLVEESNGKSVDAEGEKLETKGSAFIIPAEGPLDQHSFFQNRHQGPWKSPFDFLVVVNNLADFGKQQTVTIANAMGQIEALTKGKSSDIPDQHFEGNTPANVFIIPEMTPKAIGMMIGLWEARTYADAYLQGINPSDQPGVQLGKVNCKVSQSELENKEVIEGQHDPAMADILQTVIDMMQL